MADVVKLFHSRTEAQNEAIIREFLAQEDSAFLLPIPYLMDLEQHPVQRIKLIEGAACAVRFEPELSASNGFFICLISKNRK